MSNITRLVEDISNTYDLKSQEEVKAMNIEELTACNVRSKICVNELDEVSRLLRNFLEKYQEEVTVVRKNSVGETRQESASRVVRNLKTEFSLLVDFTAMVKRNKEDRAKQQQLQIEKNLGSKPIPEVCDDGDIVPYLLHI